MSASVESESRHEVEDLWWFRRCVESMIETADVDGTIRVRAIRALLETTRPLTSHTEPTRKREAGR